MSLPPSLAPSLAPPPALSLAALRRRARGLVALAAALLLPLLLALTPAAAREFTDATGRTVTIPDAPERVFAAGPPASVLLYMLAPDRMVGWARGLREADLPYVLPEVRELPELGRLTGRGDTVNLEVLLAARPDLIVDYGTVSPTYVDLANRITEQTGIPDILIDGSFPEIPQALRSLSQALGVPERGEALAGHAEARLAQVDAVLAQVPQAGRPRVYLARGPEGLETPARGSINAEIVERVGAETVAVAETRGLVTPSLEQVIAWAPDTIVTIDGGFAGSVGQNPDWQAVPAVAAGRVFLAPSLPFGFIDTPPSVNRLVGLTWLLHEFYPDRVAGDMRAEVRDFYRLFYQVELDDAALARLLGD